MIGDLVHARDGRWRATDGLRPPVHTHCTVLRGPAAALHKQQAARQVSGSSIGVPWQFCRRHTIAARPGTSS
jgi:hypothetical protein